MTTASVVVLVGLVTVLVGLAALLRSEAAQEWVASMLPAALPTPEPALGQEWDWTEEQLDATNQVAESSASVSDPFGKGFTSISAFYAWADQFQNTVYLDYFLVHEGLQPPVYFTNKADGSGIALM